MKKLNIENIESVLNKVVGLDEWLRLQDSFNRSTSIYLAGNGGNLAIADHGAIDMTRHTDKNIICGGSAVLATSIINDVGFDSWMSKWLDFSVRGKSEEDLKSCMFLGISASGTSKNVVEAAEWSLQRGMKAAVITAKPLYKEVKGATVVELGVEYYHTAEVLTLTLFYQLIEGGGYACPKIS
jgi:D-sedoheptulose 7-phosphate isomerase